MQVYSFTAAVSNFQVFEDTIALCNATSAAFNFQLPDATTCIGRKISVKKTDSTANAVTLTTTSSQTIDGASTYGLSSQYAVARIVSNGTNWFLI
jgi:hypothetical protein